MNIMPDIHCNLDSVRVYKCKVSNKPYNCILNQTNIHQNSNKFYIMQILSSTLFTNIYYLYLRYGRVGERGQTHINTYISKEIAIKEYTKKFRIKTGCVWDGVFTPYPNKYILMDLDDNFDIETIDKDEESKLDPKVEDIIRLISNKKNMITSLKNLDVDTKKLPLGKISSKQISNAKELLSLLKGCVDAKRSNREAAGVRDPENFLNLRITKLSSDFWSIVPYACGRNRPPLINSTPKLEKFAELLEVLENVCISLKIRKKSVGIDDIYKELSIELVCIPHNLSSRNELGNSISSKNDVWDTLKKYVTSTHTPTHNYDLELLEVFQINKEHINPEIFENTPIHKLLVHGSRMINYMGILSEGLRIPSHSQVTNGCVLGKGVYFADTITKSFNYCNAHETEGIGFVILCEVGLGAYPEYVQTAGFDDLPSSRFTSRIARGNYQPEPSDAKTIYFENSNIPVVVPQGKMINSNLSSYSSFLYNEYVIYNPSLYRFRYLLKLKSTRH